MRQLWKKAAAIGFLLFMALWLVGSLRALALDSPPQPVMASYFGEPSGARFLCANNLKQIGLATTPLPLVLEQPEVEKIQVYEKNAQIGLATTAFDEDLARIRAAMADGGAVVFYETNNGLTSEQRVTLQIGVHPDKFDALVAKLRKIGQLEAISVQQRDRTSEFRGLTAQRQALKSYLQSVLKLREVKSVSIDDALKLEQKIQDIEKELQNIGVQLGDLLGKESYYNIHLTVAEFQPASSLGHAYTLPKRIFHGLGWALCWWLGAAVGVTLMAGTYVSVRSLWWKPAQTA